MSMRYTLDMDINIYIYIEYPSRTFRVTCFQTFHFCAWGLACAGEWLSGPSREIQLHNMSLPVPNRCPDSDGILPILPCLHDNCSMHEELARDPQGTHKGLTRNSQKKLPGTHMGLTRDNNGIYTDSWNGKLLRVKRTWSLPSWS